MATTVKHRIALYIEWQSIYRDIADKCDMLAKAVRLSAGKDEELGERLEGEMRFEDDYSNFIRREMTTALSYIQVELNKWVWDNGHLATARIIKEDTIKIIAHAPKSFDLALRYPLARLIEAYLVNRAMMMWCGIYHKNDVQLYTSLAQEAMQGIKRIKNSRIRYFGSAKEVQVIVGDSGTEPSSSDIPVKTIVLDASSKSIATGASFTLAANLSPTNATDKTVEWKSSNEKMITVTPSNDGTSALVKSISQTIGTKIVYQTGTAYVTVTAASGVTAQCAVSVYGQKEIEVTDTPTDTPNTDSGTTDSGTTTPDTSDSIDTPNASDTPDSSTDAPGSSVVNP